MPVIRSQSFAEMIRQLLSPPSSPRGASLPALSPLLLTQPRPFQQLEGVVLAPQAPAADADAAAASIAAISDAKYRQLEARAKGARLVVGGFCTPDDKLQLTLWPPGATKPTLEDLRTEVKTRLPGARRKNWRWPKCISVLLNTPPIDPGNPPLQLAPALKGRNWSMQRGMARLTNCVVPTKEAFLLRDLKLDRSDIDSSKKDPYWSDLVISFNDAIKTEVNYNRHPSIDQCRSLAFDCSEFVGTSKTLRKKNTTRSGAALSMVWLDIADQVRFINNGPSQNLLL